MKEELMKPIQNILPEAYSQLHQINALLEEEYDSAYDRIYMYRDHKAGKTRYQAVRKYRGNTEHLFYAPPDDPRVREVQRQKLIRTIKKSAADAEKTLSKVLETCPELNPSVVVSGFRRQYQAIPPISTSELLRGRSDAKADAWMTAAYDSSPRPFTKKLFTTAGVQVRSRAEVLIGNTLEKYGIRYHYEELKVLIGENGNMYKSFPDFTIWINERRRLIWEHLGMLSNERYLEISQRKIRSMLSEGMIFGQDLILTNEWDGDLDSSIVENIIKSIILPQIGRE